jgi:excisionase family DNA binding protein
MTDMTVGEVAAALGVTERTVRRWLREGRLDAYRVGGRVRVPARAVRDAAAPYGPEPGQAAADPIASYLEAPARLAAARRRALDHAFRLMDQVRSGASGPLGPGRVRTDAATLVREVRDEQDEKWDGLLGNDDSRR